MSLSLLDDPQASLAPSPVPAVPDANHVPLKVRIGWGFGGLADNYMMSGLTALGVLIYTLHFKLSPELAGMSMMIPRFVDAIFDPLFGHISDNTRSRWGRRRPYMFMGVFLCAFMLPFIWMPPFLSTVGLPWHHNIPFLFFTIMSTVYSLAYSLFVVPYTALGYELTNDYDEKTRVLAWRMYIGLFGSMTAPALYRLCLLKIFPNEAVGAIWVCAALSIIIIGTGLMPILACKERVDVQQQETVNVLDAILYTFQNRAFMILSLAFTIILVGLNSAGILGGYIGIYYLFHGDKVAASKLGMIAGAIGAITSYISMFLIAKLSRKLSKGAGMNIGLGFALAGILGGIITLDPRWPYAQIITTIIASLGLQGCWLMISSMVGDVCDEDELASGARREGMFGAVNGFCQKIAIAITYGLGGYLVTMAGFDTKMTETGVPLPVALKMKYLIIGFQSIGLIIAMVVFLFYPITRERAAETRRKLDERKRQQEFAAIQ